MTHRTQLLLVMSMAGIACLGVVAIALTEDGAAHTVLLLLGGAGVVVSVVGLIATVRWLGPATRLPEHLRDEAGRSTGWRPTVVSLELQDGTRITCVVVRPGGYVTPRRTDPPFDARHVVAVVPATEADYEAERARQHLHAHPDDGSTSRAES